MELGTFRSNRRAREEGVRTQLPGTDDVWVTVRSEDYAPYRRAITKIVEEQSQFGRYSRRKQARIGDPVKFDQKRGEAIARHLLVSWEGLTENKEVVPYSVETALRYLTDPDYYDFYLAVAEAIEGVTGAKDEWEEDRGNS